MSDWLIDTSVPFDFPRMLGVWFLAGFLNAFIYWRLCYSSPPRLLLAGVLFLAGPFVWVMALLALVVTVRQGIWQQVTAWVKAVRGWWISLKGQRRDRVSRAA